MEVVRTGVKAVTRGAVGIVACYTGYQYYSTTHVFFNRAHAEVPAGSKAADSSSAPSKQDNKEDDDHLRKWHDNSGC